MSTKSIRRGVAAVLMVAAGTLFTVAAHETESAPQRGKELFKPGLDHAAEAGKSTETNRPPLYQGLGNLTMSITTRVPAAQAYFDQGLRLTWGFNHSEARRSFQEAQRHDPECAMCFWGEAFVLGPNINDAMHEEDYQPAIDAVRQAQSLKARTTPKEQALIEALATRYAADAGTDRTFLDVAWGSAMSKVAEAYPDDANVLALYADSLMNLQPWDYWEADGVTNKGRGADIVAALERALQVDPHHPAAAHLYIHAVEASADPARAEAVADRLRGIMPAAGHLTHMPAHIYVRVGRHSDSIAVNRDAIAADEAFLSEAGDQASSLYRYGYYPHNVHFLLMSAQMAGVRKDAISAAEKLAAVTSDEVSQELAWVQAIKTAPYSAHAQFSDVETVLALPRPGDEFPFVMGYWHYARGVALARTGDVEGASLEVAAIERIIAEADLSNLLDQYLPAKDVLGIAKHVVAARIAQVRGDLDIAEQHLREAIALQDATSYMEPPYWYYPVRQTLGAVLLQAGRHQDSIEAFQGALKDSPRNGWALWGLMQAQIAAGEFAAEDTKAALATVWLGDDRLLELNRL